MGVIKKASIPEGKVIFPGYLENRQDSFSYRNDDYLTELTPFEFRFHLKLTLGMDIGTNKLFEVTESVRNLSERFDISKNSISNLIKSAVDNDFVKIKPNTNHYVYNPFVAFRGTFFDFSLLDLFASSRYYSESAFQFIVTLRIENNIYVQPDHNIYILEHELTSGYKLFKIGFSENIEARLQSYLNCNPTIRLVSSFKVENPRQFEREIHSKYLANYGNEWYNLWIMQKINQKYEFGLNL